MFRFVLLALVLCSADLGSELREAAKQGDAAKVKELLVKGADPDDKDKNGLTALHMAASTGHSETAKVLLDAGADVNAKEEKEGKAPLHLAAMTGHSETEKVLADAGADVDAKDKDGRTPLHNAASRGQTKMVKVLLHAGAKIEAKDKDGRTPLHTAASRGQTKTVKVLLDAGANKEAKDQDDQTPLQAAHFQHETIRVLVDAGAKVNASDPPLQAEEYPLIFGSSPFSNIKCVRPPGNLTCPTEVSQADGPDGSKHTFKVFFDRDGLICSTSLDPWKVNLVVRCKQAPHAVLSSKDLRVAASHGDTARVKELLAQGADPNDKDQYGWTSLRWATYTKHPETAKVLVDAGADVNSQALPGSPEPRMQLAIGSSLHSPTKCAPNPFNLTCDDEAQMGRGKWPETFQVYQDGDQVCAHRIDFEKPWGVHLVLHCRLRGQKPDAWTHAESHRSFRTVTQGPEALAELVIGSNLESDIKCVRPSAKLSCPTHISQAARGFTFNVHEDDQGRICAKRTDTSSPWGMHLVISCTIVKAGHWRTATHEGPRKFTDSYEFVVGSSWSSSTKCVDDPGHIYCDDKSFAATSWVTERFHVYHEKSKICARRTDSDNPWSLHVVLQCLPVAKAWQKRVDRVYGETPLHDAAVQGSTETAKVLLGAGADVHAKEKYGKTPLHDAAYAGHPETAKVLVDAGADVHAQDFFGNTALHDAALQGQTETAKVLLAAGADVDAKDVYGDTPLREAAWKGHPEVAKVLVDAGADVDAKDKNGEAALHKTVKMLIDKGADVHTKDWRNETLMHWAISGAHHGTVKMLVDAGAVNTEDFKDAVGKLGCLEGLTLAWIKQGGRLDNLPPDANTARNCALRSMSYVHKLQSAFCHWQTYAWTAGALAAALLAVAVEGRYVRAAWAGYRRVEDAGAGAEHFLRGARLLVAKARTRYKGLKLAMRAMEVAANGCLIIGAGMIVVWWPYWLPACLMVFGCRAWYHHGLQPLLQAPILSIARTSGRSAIALLQLTVLGGLVVFMMWWPRDNVAYHVNWARNPLERDIHQTLSTVWPQQNLAIDFRATHPPQTPTSWLQAPWLYAMTIRTIAEYCLYTLLAFMAIYVVCLVVLSCHDACCAAPKTSDIEHGSRHLLVEGFDDKALLTDLPRLRKETWLPRGITELFDAILVKLLFISLDLLLDFNTILSLLMSRNYKFAGSLTFVVARSTFKQLENLGGFREALNESLERGILHEQVLQIFDEEKGSEAFFSLIITSYSYVFCVQTATQAILQGFSIVLSIYGLAVFLVERLDLDFEPPEGPEESPVSPHTTLLQSRGPGTKPQTHDPDPEAAPGA